MKSYEEEDKLLYNEKEEDEEVICWEIPCPNPDFPNPGWSQTQAAKDL